MCRPFPLPILSVCEKERDKSSSPHFIGLGDSGPCCRCFLWLPVGAKLPVSPNLSIQTNYFSVPQTQICPSPCPAINSAPPIPKSVLPPAPLSTHVNSAPHPSSHCSSFSSSPPSPKPGTDPCCSFPDGVLMGDGRGGAVLLFTGGEGAELLGSS